MTDSALPAAIRPPRPNFRIVIITRNSAAWLGTMLDAYGAMKLSPYVLLDDRSSDGTGDILASRGIDHARVRADLPRVEATIARIPEFVDAPWVLRLDDDELPSRGLIAWATALLYRPVSTVIGFERRNIRPGPDGAAEYSRHPQILSPLGVLDAQWRLFQPHRVTYDDAIHRPGFYVPPGSPIAPHAAFIAHFSWLTRSLEQRRRQLESYEAQQLGAGSRFRDLMLWEESDPVLHAFAPLGTHEFDTTIAGLRQIRP